jgi:hypothetical protein
VVEGVGLVMGDDLQEMEELVRLNFRFTSAEVKPILALAREALSFRKKYGMSFDEWEEKQKLIAKLKCENLIK